MGNCQTTLKLSNHAKRLRGVPRLRARKNGEGYVRGSLDCLKGGGGAKKSSKRNCLTTLNKGGALLIFRS